MAFRLRQILKVLEKLAPPRLSESWDNSGLQTGDPEAPVDKILISLDPTVEAVREASKRDAQMLLTHHPLIFTSLSSLEPSIYPGDVLYEAIQKGVAVASFHTNLDAAIGGINDLLAEVLGLGEVCVLEGERASREAGEGLGRIGVLPEPVRLSDLVRNVKQVFQISTAGVVGPPDRRIHKVAVVGGSGSSLIPDALRRGADALITGDVGHHDAMAAIQGGIAVIDAGHFHTEKAAMGLFRNHLASRLEKEVGERIEVDLFQGEESPMRYE